MWWSLTNSFAVSRPHKYGLESVANALKMSQNGVTAAIALWRGMNGSIGSLAAGRFVLLIGSSKIGRNGGRSRPHCVVIRMISSRIDDNGVAFLFREITKRLTERLGQFLFGFGWTQQAQKEIEGMLTFSSPVRCGAFTDL